MWSGGKPGLDLPGHLGEEGLDDSNTVLVGRLLFSTRQDFPSNKLTVIDSKYLKSKSCPLVF